MTDLGRVFAHATVRRIAHVLIALALGYIGLRDAHANTPLQAMQACAAYPAAVTYSGTISCSDLGSFNMDSHCAPTSPRYADQGTVCGLRTNQYGQWDGAVQFGYDKPICTAPEVYSTVTHDCQALCPSPLVWNTTTYSCEDPGFDPDKNLGPPSCPVAAPPLTCGNPINSGTSNKLQEETDIPTSGLLGFKRYYNSLSGAPTHLLGAQWTNTYTRKIDGQPSTAMVMRPGGTTYTYTLVAGQWQSDPDVTAKLQRLETPTGELLGWTYKQDDLEVEYYDTQGRLTRITRANGESVILAYINDFQLTSVTAQDGRSLVFAYDTSLRISTITDSSGVQIVYQYDASNRLTNTLYPGGASKTYVYNEPTFTSGADIPMALTGIVDENNQRYATFNYSPNGKAVSTEHAGGVDKYVVSYGQDQSAAVTLPAGVTQQRSFITLNGVKRIAAISEATPNGTRNRSYTYDSYGRTDLATDALGITVDYDFNARGLQSQVVENTANTANARRSTQTDWHASFDVPVERRVYDSGTSLPGVLKSKSAWTYNSRGQALTSSQIDPATSATRTATTTYCEQSDIDAGTCPLLGLVRSIDGSRTDVSDITTYTYYASDDPICATAPSTCPHRKGDLWKVTNALGQVTENLKYDGAGRVLSVKDANGVVTDLEYHPRGWLAARKVRGTNDAVETDDAITRIEYWPTGLVKKVTQADGTFTTYTYDAAHRLSDIADNAGDSIHYVLDNAGNRISEETKDNAGTLLRSLSRVYDLLGQLQTAADAYANPTDFNYDANGNTDTVTDALNRVSDNDYDPLSRLSKTIQNVGGINATTQFQYDALDNLTQVTDPKGLNTGYQYNGLNDLTQLTSPDTGVTDYTYDSAGNRKTQTDARGITATYSYDALNRLTGITYPTSELDVTYQYDTVNAVCDTQETFATGRLNKLTDGSGATEYCYDRRGNPVRKVQTTNGKVFTLRYGYTLADRLASITYPSGARVDYTHNALGQPSGVTYTPAGGSAQVLLTNVTYYPFGPAAELEYADGRHLKRTLNQNYQPGIVEDLGVDGLSLGYEFDAVGNLSKLRKGDQAEPPTRKYGYDGLNRLSEARDGATDALLQGYGYDATGNRTSATVGASTTTYTYPTTNHRLSSVGSTARLYDAVGNTTKIGSGGNAKGFVFDAMNRLSQTKNGNQVAMNYAYNGKGEQVRRYPTAASTAQTYAVYDEAGHVFGSYDNTGTRLQEVIWLDDLPVGVIANNQLHYVQADHLGTPRVVIDPVREKTVWRWELAGEAFGNTAPNQDPDADGTAFIFDLRFSGQTYDSASGLNYNYFRDYETGIGRYIESDPVGQKGGTSTYGYSNQDPMFYRDPYGLWCVPLFDDSTAWRVKSRRKNMGNIEATVFQGLNCIFHNAWFITEERMKRTKSLCYECVESNCPDGGSDCNFVIKNGAWGREERLRTEKLRDRALTTYANGKQCTTCRNPFTGIPVTACEGDVQGGDGVYKNPRNPLGH